MRRMGEAGRDRAEAGFYRFMATEENAANAVWGLASGGFEERGYAEFLRAQVRRLKLGIEAIGARRS
jgi:hypothetical protein